MPNPLEEMLLSCPEDICDGSGTIVDEDGVERKCPCVLDYNPNHEGPWN